MALVDCTVTVHPNDTVVSTTAATSVQVSAAVNEVQVQGAAGIRGPKGEKGDPGEGFVTQAHPAGTTLSGHRALRVSGGLAYICDGADRVQAGRCIGIGLNAALEGDDVTIQTAGSVSEPSWNWSEGAVFVGVNGTLTQSLLGLAFIHQLGVATSPTQIDINPVSPILIS